MFDDLLYIIPPKFELAQCGSPSLIGVVDHPGTRTCPGGPEELPGVTRSPGKLRIIVNLYRGGSNYGPQAVGTALDFIVRAARRANPCIYNAYALTPYIHCYLHLTG